MLEIIATTLFVLWPVGYGEGVRVGTFIDVPAFILARRAEGRATDFSPTISGVKRRAR